MLAGVEYVAPGVKDVDGRLALVVPDHVEDARVLWQAWDDGATRCGGRFASLLVAGFRPAACDLADVVPFGRPPALEIRYERTKLGHRPYKHDPLTGERATA